MAQNRVQFQAGLSLRTTQRTTQDTPFSENSYAWPAAAARDTHFVSVFRQNNTGQSVFWNATIVVFCR